MLGYIQKKLIKIGMNNNCKLTGSDFKAFYGFEYKNEISKWIANRWLVILDSGFFQLTQDIINIYEKEAI